MNKLLLCSLLLALSSQCRASVIVSISPSSQTVPLGGTVNIDVNVSGLGGGTALGTFDVDLLFDSALLSFNLATFGNQLDLFGLGSIQSVTPGPGSVNIFELSLDSITDLNTLQATQFRLATLTFTTLALGSSSPITLSVNALGDASGGSIPATLQSASLTVEPASSVPEPRTWPMVGLGIGGLVGIRRFALASRR